MTSTDDRRRLTAALARTAPPGEYDHLAALTFRAADVRDPASNAVTRGVVFGLGGSVAVAVPHLQDEWGADPARVAETLRSIADVLRAARPADLVLRFPGVAARLVEATAGDGLPDHEGWLVAARLGEAAKIVLDDSSLDADPTSPARTARPLLHRAGFLLLTAPVGYPGEDWPTRQVFGTRRQLTARAEQARLDWALDLVNHDEHPVLRRLPAPVVDAELRMLARPAHPPGASDPPSAGSDDEKQFRIWLAQQAFLPRFMLDATWTAVRPPALAWFVLALLALVAASPLLGAPWAGSHPETVLYATAAVVGIAYLLVGSLLVYRPESATLWCLRLPAGAALGAVALISVDDDWAETSGYGWIWASLALIAVTIGYLITEAVGHGVPRGRPLAERVAMIALLGYAHATAVAVATLAVVVPAVKPTLDATFTDQDALGVGPTTVLAASVGLAAGVLLQVLWDDRPVTYPLSHLPWRGRAR